MNKDNLIMLTNVVYNHSLNYPDEHIDLVNAWLSLNVSRPILALMDNDSDYFRAMCMWLRADGGLTAELIMLNGNLNDKRISSTKMFEELRKLTEA